MLFRSAYRMLNLEKLDHVHTYKQERLALELQRENLRHSLSKLNELIENFSKHQVRLSNNAIKTISLSLLCIAFLFFSLHLLFWQWFLKQIHASFATGADAIRQLLDNRQDSYSHVIFKEISEFIDGLKHMVLKFNQSQRNLAEAYKKLYHVREDERNNIAQYLHDNFGQNVVALKLELSLLKIGRAHV